MSNPLEWKPSHLLGWAGFMAVGAVLGMVLGYFVTKGPDTMMSLTYWIQRDSFDALIWGIMGALAFGGVVYAIKAFST
jgi:hypothetical protein